MEKAAVRILSQKTQAGFSTQLTWVVVAATAAMKFGSTSLAEAARGGRGLRETLRSEAAAAAVMAAAGGKAVEGSEEGQRWRKEQQGPK